MRIFIGDNVLIIGWPHGNQQWLLRLNSCGEVIARRRPYGRIALAKFLDINPETPRLYALMDVWKRADTLADIERSGVLG